MRIVAMGCAQGFGGLQTHFRLLVDFMIREGHEVGIIQVGDSPGNVHAGGIFQHVLPHTANTPAAILKKMSMTWRARKDAIRFAPQLMIGAATGRAYALMAKSMPHITFKFYQEVCYDIPERDPLYTRMDNCFDAVAAQSPLIGSIYRKQIPGDKPVRILPCFAEPVSCEQKPDLPKRNESLRFCYFGRLAANKGLAEFLIAFAKTAQDVDAVLDIHGSGMEWPALEDVVRRLGIGSRVRLCGRYPEGEDYAKLLASYHCLILPSRCSEGLPLVLIEAMSCGVPFLATNIGAIPDAAIGNEDALLMSPSEESMEEGVRKMAKRLRDGSFSAARIKEYYQRHFSPSVMEEAWHTMLVDPKGYFS